MRDREDHVEVLDWEKLFFSIIDPFCLSQELALWAMAIAAGVVGELLVFASVALKSMSAKDGSPAVHNVGDDFRLDF
jgi:hypothetical protein